MTDDRTSKFLIPAAIAFAGIVIAVAVVYSNGKSPQGVVVGDDQQVALAAISAISSADYVLGDQNAPVTVIEYGDFQCPYCGKYFADIESVLREEYVKTGKIKFVYRDFAFLGQESLWAANAARCAGEQGKFWEYHDYLYGNQSGENQGAFSKKNLKNFAAAIGLDNDKFNLCLDSDKYKSAIQKETQDGGAAGVSGTPATFINGQLYPGIAPVLNFTQLIDAELTK